MGLDTTQLLANIRKRKAELQNEDSHKAQHENQHKKPALDTKLLLSKIRERKSQLKESKPNPYLSGDGRSRKFKPLIFNRQGKYIEIAEKAQKKQEIEDLKASASLSSVNLPTEPPDHEWWDELEEEITAEIHSPEPTIPPSERLDPGEIKAYMTKKETKRMRKHNRYQQRQEAQDRIRLGLDPPPPPKISQKNVVAVVGAEYYADPTKFDVLAANQVAERRKVHEQTNAENKLDPEAKWAKHVAKVERDKAKGLHCAVMKVPGLVSGERRYILNAGAEKLLLTGVLLCAEPFTLAIVEGGGLEVKKFHKLAMKTANRDDAGEAILVWRGELRTQKFKKWSTHAMPVSESLDLLRLKDADNYWKLAEKV